MKQGRLGRKQKKRSQWAIRVENGLLNIAVFNKVESVTAVEQKTN